ncbi:unnamed protein product [Amoebophrya sp. A120]|nr:unnamed protein product [Amoebophrya sp. A120]|eukprot:GSA120T00014917001.1
MLNSKTKMSCFTMRTIGRATRSPRVLKNVFTFAAGVLLVLVTITPLTSSITPPHSVLPGQHSTSHDPQLNQDKHQEQLGFTQDQTDENAVVDAGGGRNRNSGGVPIIPLDSTTRTTHTHQAAGARTTTEQHVHQHSKCLSDPTSANCFVKQTEFADEEESSSSFLADGASNAIPENNKPGAEQQDIIAPDPKGKPSAKAGPDGTLFLRGTSKQQRSSPNHRPANFNWPQGDSGPRAAPNKHTPSTAKAKAGGAYYNNMVVQKSEMKEERIIIPTRIIGVNENGRFSSDDLREDENDDDDADNLSHHDSATPNDDATKMKEQEKLEHKQQELMRKWGKYQVTTLEDWRNRTETDPFAFCGVFFRVNVSFSEIQRGTDICPEACPYLQQDGIYPCLLSCVTRKWCRYEMYQDIYNYNLSSAAEADVLGEHKNVDKKGPPSTSTSTSSRAAPTTSTSFSSFVQENILRSSSWTGIGKITGGVWNRLFGRHVEVDVEVSLSSSGSLLQTAESEDHSAGAMTRKRSAAPDDDFDPDADDDDNPLGDMGGGEQRGTAAAAPSGSTEENDQLQPPESLPGPRTSSLSDHAPAGAAEHPWNKLMANADEAHENLLGHEINNRMGTTSTRRSQRKNRDDDFSDHQEEQLQQEERAKTPALSGKNLTEGGTAAQKNLPDEAITTTTGGGTPHKDNGTKKKPKEEVRVPRQGNKQETTTSKKTHWAGPPSNLFARHPNRRAYNSTELKCDSCEVKGCVKCQKDRHSCEECSEDFQLNWGVCWYAWHKNIEYTIFFSGLLVLAIATLIFSYCRKPTNENYDRHYALALQHRGRCFHRPQGYPNEYYSYCGTAVRTEEIAGVGFNLYFTNLVWLLLYAVGAALMLYLFFGSADFSTMFSLGNMLELSLSPQRMKDMCTVLPGSPEFAAAVGATGRPGSAPPIVAQTLAPGGNPLLFFPTSSTLPPSYQNSKESHEQQQQTAAQHGGAPPGVDGTAENKPPSKTSSEIVSSVLQKFAELVSVRVNDEVDDSLVPEFFKDTLQMIHTHNFRAWLGVCILFVYTLVAILLLEVYQRGKAMKHQESPENVTMDRFAIRMTGFTPEITDPSEIQKWLQEDILEFEDHYEHFRHEEADNLMNSRATVASALSTASKQSKDPHNDHRTKILYCSIAYDFFAADSHVLYGSDYTKTLLDRFVLIKDSEYGSFPLSEAYGKKGKPPRFDQNGDYIPDEDSADDTPWWQPTGMYSRITAPLLRRDSKHKTQLNRGQRRRGPEGEGTHGSPPHLHPDMVIDRKDQTRASTIDDERQTQTTGAARMNNSSLGTFASEASYGSITAKIEINDRQGTTAASGKRRPLRGTNLFTSTYETEDSEVPPEQLIYLFADENERHNPRHPEVFQAREFVKKLENSGTVFVVCHSEKDRWKLVQAMMRHSLKSSTEKGKKASGEQVETGGGHPSGQMIPLRWNRYVGGKLVQKLKIRAHPGTNADLPPVVGWFAYGATWRGFMESFFVWVAILTASILVYVYGVFMPYIHYVTGYIKGIGAEPGIFEAGISLQTLSTFPGYIMSVAYGGMLILVQAMSTIISRMMRFTREGKRIEFEIFFNVFALVFTVLLQYYFTLPVSVVGTELTPTPWLVDHMAPLSFLHEWWQSYDMEMVRLIYEITFSQFVVLAVIPVGSYDCVFYLGRFGRFVTRLFSTKTWSVRDVEAFFEPTECSIPQDYAQNTFFLVCVFLQLFMAGANSYTVLIFIAMYALWELVSQRYCYLRMAMPLPIASSSVDSAAQFNLGVWVSIILGAVLGRWAQKLRRNGRSRLCYDAKIDTEHGSRDNSYCNDAGNAFWDQVWLYVAGSALCVALFVFSWTYLQQKILRNWGQRKLVEKISAEIMEEQLDIDSGEDETITTNNKNTFISRRQTASTRNKASSSPSNVTVLKLQKNLTAKKSSKENTVSTPFPLPSPGRASAEGEAGPFFGMVESGYDPRESENNEVEDVQEINEQRAAGDDPSASSAGSRIIRDKNVTKPHTRHSWIPEYLLDGDETDVEVIDDNDEATDFENNSDGGRNEDSKQTNRKMINSKKRPIIGTAEGSSSSPSRVDQSASNAITSTLAKVKNFTHTTIFAGRGPNKNLPHGKRHRATHNDVERHVSYNYLNANPGHCLKAWFGLLEEELQFCDNRNTEFYKSHISFKRYSDVPCYFQRGKEYLFDQYHQRGYMQSRKYHIGQEHEDFCPCYPCRRKEDMITTGREAVAIGGYFNDQRVVVGNVVEAGEDNENDLARRNNIVDNAGLLGAQTYDEAIDDLERMSISSGGGENSDAMDLKLAELNEKRTTSRLSSLAKAGGSGSPPSGGALVDWFTKTLGAAGLSSASSSRPPPKGRQGRGTRLFATRGTEAPAAPAGGGATTGGNTDRSNDEDPPNTSSSSAAAKAKAKAPSLAAGKEKVLDGATSDSAAKLSAQARAADFYRAASSQQRKEKGGEIKVKKTSSPAAANQKEKLLTKNKVVPGVEADAALARADEEEQDPDQGSSGDRLHQTPQAQGNATGAKSEKNTSSSKNSTSGKKNENTSSSSYLYYQRTATVSSVSAMTTPRPPFSTSTTPRQTADGGVLSTSDTPRTKNMMTAEETNHVSPAPEQEIPHEQEGSSLVQASPITSERSTTNKPRQDHRPLPIDLVNHGVLKSEKNNVGRKNFPGVEVPLPPKAAPGGRAAPNRSNVQQQQQQQQQGTTTHLHEDHHEQLLHSESSGNEATREKIIHLDHHLNSDPEEQEVHLDSHIDSDEHGHLRVLRRAATNKNREDHPEVVHLDQHIDSDEHQYLRVGGGDVGVKKSNSKGVALAKPKTSPPSPSSSRPNNKVGGNKELAGRLQGFAAASSTAAGSSAKNRNRNEAATAASVGAQGVLTEPPLLGAGGGGNYSKASAPAAEQGPRSAAFGQEGSQGSSVETLEE